MLVGERKGELKDMKPSALCLLDDQNLQSRGAKRGAKRYEAKCFMPVG